MVGFDPRVFLVRHACRANLYFGSHVSATRARTGARDVSVRVGINIAYFCGMCTAARRC